MWWSIFLALIGVTGLYLTTQKLALGFAIGLGVQGLWVVYALATGQYGFILSALAYGAVNFIGLRKWTLESKAGQRLSADEPQEARFLYFTGVNPEYPPHYWELKTSFGNVIQKSVSYHNEVGAIRDAVHYFGDDLFDTTKVMIDTSPDILAKLRREFQLHQMHKLNLGRATHPTEAMRMAPLPHMPPKPNRINQYHPDRWDSNS